MNSENLSKLLSYILRHAPNDYGIVLDEDGFTNLEVITEAIRNKHPEFEGLNQASLILALESFTKKRHEINEGKIRAIYGHSVRQVISKEVVEPPIFLYHGTTEANYKKIEKEGIKKMNRNYVHLSSSIDGALIVAKRRTKDPVLLKIFASNAFHKGIEFFNEGDVWLCDFVAPDYLTLVLD